jgi:pre-mRNA-processing factor 6
MLGQLKDCVGQPEGARETYVKALQYYPKYSTLAICSCLGREEGWFEQILTNARLKNTCNPELWLAAIGLEAQAVNKTESNSLMAKAQNRIALPMDVSMSRSY